MCESRQKMGSIREVPTQSFGVAHQQGVDQTEELHNSLILASVLVTLQQEYVRLSVGACRGARYTSLVNLPR